MKPTIRERLPDLIEQWRRERGNDCWPWPFAKCPLGYGFITIRRRLLKAHRVTYEMIKGPIPEGLQLDHLCRNPSCVNPNHLEAVTPRVNTLRSTSVTALHARQTHCKWGHEFTPANTHVRKSDGGRICRACAKLRRRKQTNYQGHPHGKDKTHCQYGHEFTPENTYLMKRTRRRGGDGVERVCRTCGRAAQRAYHARERSA